MSSSSTGLDVTAAERQDDACAPVSPSADGPRDRRAGPQFSRRRGLWAISVVVIVIGAARRRSAGKACKW